MSRQLCRSALHALLFLHALPVRRLSPEQQLAQMWRGLRDSPLAGFLAARYAHRCQFDAHELYMSLCLDFIRRNHPDFALPMRLEKLPPELQRTSPPLGAICVSTHAGHAAAATTLLKLGHPACLLVDATPNVSAKTLHARLQSRHPELRLIPNDRLSLARVMRELEGGRSICCAVDYQDPLGKTYRYVNPTLFELAKRTGRPMYFGRPDIDRAGNAVLAVDGPHFVTDPLASAQRFIGFINEGRSTPRSLSVQSR